MIGINEVAQKVVEKPQSSFDPSKRVGEVNGETKKTTYDMLSHLIDCNVQEIIK